jgi:hypothetical protein
VRCCEKQNAHSRGHFIFQNVLSFIIIIFPCDTWQGIKNYVSGFPMLIIEVHSYFAYFRNAPLQTHYLPYTFSIILNKLRATYDVVYESWCSLLVRLVLVHNSWYKLEPKSFVKFGFGIRYYMRSAWLTKISNAFHSTFDLVIQF